MRYQNHKHFKHDAPAHTGVLLVNLGTPDAPTVAAVRKYLAEFLWDPRVVEFPRPLWWLVLHAIILRIRPARVAKSYQSVWQDDGSPLLAISKNLCKALETHLPSQFPEPLKIAIAMRYGTPSIEQELSNLRAANVQRLIVLPLYPQYSATTTGAVFDEVARVLQQWRWVPSLRFIGQYHDHPAYIQAIAQHLQSYWQANEKPQRLLFSFHGLPQRYLHKGDPYFCQCHKSARLIAEHLRLDADFWHVSFQSRFGREPWLQPYTDETLKAWAAQGIDDVHIIAPGFSADCLETLEELAVENKHYFTQAGGKHFHYIPALNSSSEHVDLLSRLISEEGKHWPGIDAAYEDNSAAALSARLARAKQLGADQ